MLEHFTTNHRTDSWVKLVVMRPSLHIQKIIFKPLAIHSERSPFEIPPLLPKMISRHLWKGIEIVNARKTYED